MVVAGAAVSQTVIRQARGLVANAWTTVVVAAVS